MRDRLEGRRIATGVGTTGEGATEVRSAAVVEAAAVDVT
jgi:hypothetical protein